MDTASWKGRERRAWCAKELVPLVEGVRIELTEGRAGLRMHSVVEANVTHCWTLGVRRYAQPMITL